MNCMTRQIPHRTIRGIWKGNANADQQEGQAEMPAPCLSGRQLREPGQERTDIEIGQGTDQQAGRQAQLAEFECDRGVEVEEGGLGGAHADGKQQGAQHAVGEAARPAAEKIDGQENTVDGAEGAKQEQQLASNHGRVVEYGVEAQYRHKRG